MTSPNTIREAYEACARIADHPEDCYACDVASSIRAAAADLPQEPDEAARLRAALSAAQSRITTLEAERNTAILQVGEVSRKPGEAEGKLLASGLPGILDGWIERARMAEAQIKVLAEVHGGEEELAKRLGEALKRAEFWKKEAFRLAYERGRFLFGLQAIANFLITFPDENMDAANMQKIAKDRIGDFWRNNNV